jgi:hypothetical protein
MGLFDNYGNSENINKIRHFKGIPCVCVRSYPDENTAREDCEYAKSYGYMAHWKYNPLCREFEVWISKEEENYYQQGAGGNEGE